MGNSTNLPSKEVCGMGDCNGKQEAQLSLRDRATRACQLKSG